jgi:hypothetical protein
LGLPAEIVASTRLSVDEGVTGWVAKNSKPVIIDNKEIPNELRSRLRQPDLLSSMVLPLKYGNGTNAVLSLSSTTSTLSRNDLHQVERRLYSSGVQTVGRLASPRVIDSRKVSPLAG